MDLIITILPVVTKDLPISPRFTPYNFFYRDASSALVQLVNQWLNLDRENEYFLVPVRGWEVSPRDGFSVQSRVSLIILHTQAESRAYSRDSSRFSRRRPFIQTTIHHRVCPESIGSRNRVPMALTAESPPAQDQ